MRISDCSSDVCSSDLSKMRLVQHCSICSKKYKLEYDVGCLICEQPCKEQFTLDYVMVDPLNRTEVRTCSRKCMKKFLKFSRPKNFFKTICLDRKSVV